MTRLFSQNTSHNIACSSSLHTENSAECILSHTDKKNFFHLRVSKRHFADAAYETPGRGSAHRLHRVLQKCIRKCTSSLSNLCSLYIYIYICREPSSQYNTDPKTVPRSVLRLRALLRTVYRNDVNTHGAVTSGPLRFSVAAVPSNDTATLTTGRSPSAGRCSAAYLDRKLIPRLNARIRAHIHSVIARRSVTSIRFIDLRRASVHQADASSGPDRINRPCQSFFTRDRDRAIHILTSQSEHFSNTLSHSQNANAIVTQLSYKYIHAPFDEFAIAIAAPSQSKKKKKRNE